MKKNTIVVKKEKKYDINVVINNTALIYVGDKSGLLNIKTNEVIGEINNYHTTYDPRGKFFIQILELEEKSQKNNWKPKCIIRLYDALNEVMIMDGWELVATYKDYYDIVVARSPIDNKLHLYDKYAWRKTTNIFDTPLDDVKLLYRMYNDSFFVLTKQGKKALYFNNCFDKLPQLKTPFEYDTIEKISNVVVYTKGNEKHFVCGRDEKNEKISPKFEEIIGDDDNPNIIYAKNGTTKYAYNTYSEDLLLQIDCDNIKCLTRAGDDFNASYYFLTTRNNKFGLVVSEINNEIRKQNDNNAKITTLLENEYDEITYESYYDVFFTMKNDKEGLFIGNAYHNYTIPAQYDNIKCLGCNIYALYHGKLCDVVQVTPWNGYELLIEHCSVEKNFRGGLLYKKNGLFGIIVPDGDYHKEIIPADYNKITNFEEYYFMLEKDGVKGVLHLNEIIIPVKYKEISYGGNYSNYGGNHMIYFALKRRDDKYELAKRANYNYRSSNKDSPIEFVTNHTFDSIEFLKDIMVFKDKKYTYIYDYDEKLLKTLPPEVVVSSYKNPKDDTYDDCKEYCYCINGVYYFYKDKKFEEMHLELHDCYITTYEINDNVFEIKTFNKREHNAFCNMIEKKDDKEAEEFLFKVVGKGYYSYPSITISLIKKVENNIENDVEETED